MTELPCKPPGPEEEAQCHADVGRYKHLSIELGKDESKTQEDSVSGLVGSETVVVGECGGIFGDTMLAAVRVAGSTVMLTLHSRTKCEKK